MAVSKEELFARYKQLKSEGVNISLMELKKQMEAEIQPEASVSDNQEVQPPSGFGALSQTSAPDSIPASPAVGQPQQIVPPHDNSQPVWSTTYSQAPVQEQPAVSPPVFPQYEVDEKIQHNYANNFASNFTYSNMPEQKNAESAPQSNSSRPVITGETDKTVFVPDTAERTKYGVIGYPLGHSLSVFIHKAGFESLGLDYSYEILETPPETLVDRIKFLKYHNYAGFNVTIPLKLPITMFLDEIDISADLIGAVNTVVINPDRTMKGYNTDVLGFRNAIPKDIFLAGKTIGILGTGGAARAAITAFSLEKVKQIKIYTRSIPNSIELLNYLRAKFPMIEFNAYQIERIRDLSDIDILVNTTPIGMQGRAADMTPVEENELKTLPAGAVVYDVIYNPKKTVFLKLAQQNGYRTINGVDMFIHQAVAAEEIWIGKTPDFKDMKIAALENL